MSQDVEGIRREQSSRVMWFIGLAIALFVLWLIYSATQSSITSSNSMSMPGMESDATTMPQSMPGMNH